MKVDGQRQIGLEHNGINRLWTEEDMCTKGVNTEISTDRMQKDNMISHFLFYNKDKKKNHNILKTLPIAGKRV